MAVRCLLLLGSNVGARGRTLERAIQALGRVARTRVLRRSALYRTAPVGPGSRPFLNAAALIETGLSPMGLLAEAKRLEASSGRRPGPRWADRTLDIDILSYGSRRLRGRWLTVPHPLAAVRAFALAPAAEIAPAWRPDGRRTARELLRRLNPSPADVKMEAAARRLRRPL